MYSEKLKSIHPRKREQCEQIIKELSPYCRNVIVFGSATTLACTRTSDIDLYIWLYNTADMDKVYKTLGKITDWNFDVLFSFNTKLSRQLKNNIIKDGVCII